MSTKGAQFLHLAYQGSGSSPWPPVRYATACTCWKLEPCTCKSWQSLLCNSQWKKKKNWLLIKRSPSGHILSAVYRKPTHSDRYLNFRSEHPIQHKQSVANTLLERSKKLSSTTQDLNSELKYVKRTLLLKRYPKWMIKDKKKKQ